MSSLVFGTTKVLGCALQDAIDTELPLATKTKGHFECEKLSLFETDSSTQRGFLHILTHHMTEGSSQTQTNSNN